MSFKEAINKLHAEEKAMENKDAIKVQHSKGKLSAMERINLLLDKDSFVEVEKFTQLKSHNYNLQEKKCSRDGVITGFGKVNGRPVYFYAQDFTFMGGSMGEMHNRKIANIMDLALKNGAPCIGLLDSGGARIQEGVCGLDGGGKIFLRNTKASGVIPQISAILGPCAGIAVYSPAITDFIFMTKKLSYMFITGPDVIKEVTGEKVDFEGLGGGSIHSKKSGVAHYLAEDEKECINAIKVLLSYLPSNNLNNPPFIDTKDKAERKNNSLENIVPVDSKKVYDMKDVLKEVLDKNSFFEVHGNFAENAIVGFGRLNNSVVGIVANQPMILAGCLDNDSSDKISRFVRFCDAFNIPLINFVDVTGYLPGTDQEHSGIIRHGAKMLFSYSEATVPKISLVLRKAYGGAYIAMVSKEMGYDKVIAWPTAEIAVMGPEQAVNILHRKEIAKDKKIRSKRVKEYTDKFLNPYEAAKEGRVDMIIEPKETRNMLIKTLEMIANKREKNPPKKHGNIPL